jgi:hypothetical protein
MSFIQIKLGNIKEPTIAPEGRYSLAVTDVKGVMKESGYSVRARISFVDHKEYRAFTHFISLPASDDDKDKAEFKSLMLKRFLSLINCPYSEDGFEEGDMLGCQFKGEVYTTEPNEDNQVFNALRLPRIQE